MNNGTPLAVCETRWQSLSLMLTQMAKAASPVADDWLAYRRRVLAWAAGRLNSFGASYVEFFKWAAAPAGFSAEYAISQMLRQVGFDIEVLQNAAMQSLQAPADSEALRTLEITDKLARRAIRRAKQVGLFGKEAQANPDSQFPTALTYFQRSPYIRLVPYAPVALIGIPYAAVGVKRDYLAIPHEVGHFVFWNGQVDDGGGARFTSDLLKENLPFWLSSHVAGQWVEEIFADVFSCLVTGPVGALSLQEGLLRHGTADFEIAESDETHPVPILRPYIYSKALRQRGLNSDVNQGAANVLDQRWARLAEARAGDAKKFRLASGTEQQVDNVISPGSRLDSNKPVDRVIREIFRLGQFGTITWDIEWAGIVERLSRLDPTDDAAAYRELDEMFPARVAEVIEAPDQRPDPAQLADDPWEAWLGTLGFGPGELDPTKPVDTDRWLTIARSRGWTQGPDDHWPKVA